MCVCVCERVLLAARPPAPCARAGGSLPLPPLAGGGRRGREAAGAAEATAAEVSGRGGRGDAGTRRGAAAEGRARAAAPARGSVWLGSARAGSLLPCPPRSCPFLGSLGKPRRRRSCSAATERLTDPVPLCMPSSGAPPAPLSIFISMEVKRSELRMLRRPLEAVSENPGPRRDVGMLATRRTPRCHAASARPSLQQFPATKCRNVPTCLPRSSCEGLRSSNKLRELFTQLLSAPPCRA